MFTLILILTIDSLKKKSVKIRDIVLYSTDFFPCQCLVLPLPKMQPDRLQFSLRFGCVLLVAAKVFLPLQPPVLSLTH